MNKIPSADVFRRRAGFLWSGGGFDVYSPEALEQYNALFNELKENALTMKRGLSDDSPLSEVLAYSEQLLDWKQSLEDWRIS